MTTDYERNTEEIRTPKNHSTWTRDGRKARVIQTIVQWEYADAVGEREGRSFYAAPRCFDPEYPHSGFTPVREPLKTGVEYLDSAGDTAVLFELQEDGTAFGKYRVYEKWIMHHYTANELADFTPKEN